MNKEKFIYNKFIVDNIKFSTHERTLFLSLEKFYSNDNNFLKLSEIINGKSLISRRTIEFFVTNYCKITQINHAYIKNNKLIKYNIWSSYKDQLKAYKKIYFDPFGRGDRIPFIYKDNYLITTIAQLNFFRWFFEKDVYNYTINNYLDINNKFSNNKFKIKHKKQQLVPDNSIKKKVITF